MITRALIFLACMAATSAQACAVYKEQRWADIFASDAVILARVIKYEYVLDTKRRLGYARFTVKIEQIVSGAVPGAAGVNSELKFTWLNSTFSLPDDARGAERFLPVGARTNRNFLFALRDPAHWPHRFTATAIPPELENGVFSVLQAHCSDPFIFAGDSPESIMFQQVLQTKRDPEVELQILSEFLYDRDGLQGLGRENSRLRHELKMKGASRGGAMNMI